MAGSECLNSEYVDMLPPVAFTDRYVVQFHNDSIDAITAARRIFDHMPLWVVMLMWMRNQVVRPFGLLTQVPEGREAIGFFPVVEKSNDRVVLGFDDKHLDFRIIVETIAFDGGVTEVSADTIVRTNSWFGRRYLGVVKPFHRLIVPVMLANVNGKTDMREIG